MERKRKPSKDAKLNKPYPRNLPPSTGSALLAWAGEAPSPELPPAFSFDPGKIGLYCTTDQFNLDNMAKKKKNIPRLDNEDLYKTFGVEEKSPSFSEELDDNLAGQDLDRIASEKAASFHKPQTKQDKLQSYPPPQEELDLHRLTAVEAERKAVDFLRTSKTLKIRTVRIITGKGLHSEGPAVLPDVVETKLTEFKSTGLIFDFRWEKREKLKSGSVIVYLK